METFAFLEYACNYEILRDKTVSSQTLEWVYRLGRVKARGSVSAIALCLCLLSALSPLYMATMVLALKRGDTGLAVTEVQQQLANQGFYNGPFTEFYGEMTEAAVKRFQQAKGLTADGIVGPSTLLVLRGGGQSQPTSSSSSDSGALKEGRQGTDVTRLQDQLRAKGFFSGNSTGYFGSQTKAAVISFQKSQGLTADGIAGSRTLGALNRSSTISTSASTPSSGNSGSLRQGDRGPRVQQLQSDLKAAGFFQGNTTDYFGTQTEAAVIGFQRSRNLIADGIAGRATFAALNSTIVSPQSATENEEDIREVTSKDVSGTLRPSQEKQSGVESLQTKLAEKGYYSGTIDGIYGSGTVQAVEAFQGDRDLTVDGIAGPKTMDAFDSETASNNVTLQSVSGVLELSRVYSMETEMLQEKLQALGCNPGAVDGKYGSQTEAAVRRFQEKNNLTVDGKVGPQTRDALKQASCVMSDVKDPDSVEPKEDEKVLKRGDMGPNVKQLQDSLKSLGHFPESERTTNIFGPMTEAAVISFQLEKSIEPANGIADSITQASIREELDQETFDPDEPSEQPEPFEPDKPSEQPEPLESDEPSEQDNISIPVDPEYLNQLQPVSDPVEGQYFMMTLKQQEEFCSEDESGTFRTDAGVECRVSTDSVQAVHRRLDALQYAIDKTDFCNKRYKESTQEAILKFQQDSGLEPSGIVGRETMDTLVRESPQDTTEKERIDC